MSAKMIHSMIRVLDDQKSIKFYQEVLDLEIAKRLDFSDFSLIYLSNSETNFELELTYNHGVTKPYELGTGYGHLAVSVENLDKTHSSLIEKGYQPLPIKSLSQGSARFFFIQDPDGYKIEFLERVGRYL
ncbi:MAG: glyoxalase superfamily protein [Mangrovibacterium sp.]